MRTSISVPLTRGLFVDAEKLPSLPDDLWHFTCSHVYGCIGKRGTLKPHPHPLMLKLGPVIWLTSDPAPTRDDVGMSSTLIDCDRMAYRYRVAHPRGVAWDQVAHLVAPTVRADLEAFARPDTWWVTPSEQQAVLA